MTSLVPAVLIPTILCAASTIIAATQEELAAEKAEFDRLRIRPEQLEVLHIKTALVQDGEARAAVCVPNVYRALGTRLQSVIEDVTGVRLPLISPDKVDVIRWDKSNLILIGNLDSNRAVERLYGNFFVCLDSGYTGVGGYVHRTVHDPFANGCNFVLVGGSEVEGMRNGVEAFIRLVREKGKRGELILPRLLTLEFRSKGRAVPIPKPLTESERDAQIAAGEAIYERVGTERAAAQRLIRHAMLYHRTGDLREAEIYRALMLRHIRYYSENEYIQSKGMRRYDRDFRDSWAWKFVVTWDLLEEVPIFSDDDRLAITNHVLRVVLECIKYQHWDTPQAVERWSKNTNIVHNHNTWPALGVYFGGRYFGGHYKLPPAGDWEAIGRGILYGQSLSSKPLEDAASYQWLPLRHAMYYAFASGDYTFFNQGHARAAGNVAMMCVDNLGYQPAFGDHAALKACSAIPDLLAKVAWATRDGRYVWMLNKIGKPTDGELLERYDCDVAPVEPTDLLGITVSRLPRQAYDYCARSPQYPTTPNLPYEVTFDKMTCRSGFDPTDQYLLLDGFSRGTHMHFDGNAIIRFAAENCIFLMDGEYIKNAPKYHNTLMILRDGEAQLTPAVTGLDYTADLTHTGFSKTYIVGYNGARWARHLLWAKGRYFIVLDSVQAETPGDYTLRCCWRVMGWTELDGSTLKVQQRGAHFRLQNADGSSSRLKRMKYVGNWPVYGLYQQVSHKFVKGERYTFQNLFYAAPDDSPVSYSLERIDADTVRVKGQEGFELWGLTQGTRTLGEIRLEAKAFRLSQNGFALADARRIEMPGFALEIAAAASNLAEDANLQVELNTTDGSGVIVAEHEMQITIKSDELKNLSVNDVEQTMQNGEYHLTLSHGRHRLAFAQLHLPALTKAISSLPEARNSIVAEPPKSVGGLKSIWSFSDFPTASRPLPVMSAVCDRETYGRYGPVGKTIDGMFSSSTHSAMWAPGVTATVTFDLGKVTALRKIALRVWEMSESWRGMKAEVSLSNDDFHADIRPVAGRFKKTGTQRWGGNVNTIYTLRCRAEARHVRIRFTPPDNEHSVYLAEAEFFGFRPGEQAEIVCLITADINRDGALEVIAASDAQQVVALDAEGNLIWRYDAPMPVNALAAGDLNGDRREEVVIGGDGAKMVLLDSNGKPLWEYTAPPYRGIVSDIICLLIDDLDADGVPEIVAGVKSWQYIAVTPVGEEKWRNIIYAHSATIGHAADVNNDGKKEIIAGNAYYTINLIDANGKRIWNRYHLGPEQTAIATSDVNGDGFLEILVGTDLGEVHVIDREAKPLWHRSVGDRVTNIVPADLDSDGREELIVGAESGYVFAFNPDGTIRWRRNVGYAVTRVIPFSPVGNVPRFAVAAGNGGVIVLGATGEIQSSWQSESSVIDVSITGISSMVVSLAGGRVVGIKVKR